MINDIRRWRTQQLKEIKKKYKVGTLAYLTAFLKGIEYFEEIKREKLTMADFKVLVEITKEMVDFGGSAEFISANVKDFFERHGFDVRISEDGVGFIVACKEEETKI